MGTADGALVSAATGVFFLSTAFTTPFVGRLLTRIPARWIALVASFVVGAAVLVLGSAHSAAQLVLAFILLGIGMVGCGPVVFSTFMVQRFPLSASRPLGIVMTGLSVGGILLTPVLSIAIAQFGLAAVAPFAAAFHVVAVGIPASIGLKVPRGLPVVTSSAPLPLPVDETALDRPVSKLAVVTISAFAVTLLVAQVATSTQLVSLAEQRMPDLAYLAVPLLAGSGVLFRIAVVVLLPGIAPARLLLWSAASQAAALVVLALAPGAPLVIAAIIALGFSIGNAPAALPLLVLERFGPHRYPRTYAVVGTTNAIGAATGTALFGLLAQLAHGFEFPVLLAAALTLASIAILLRMRSR
jgi:MFS family permease